MRRSAAWQIQRIGVPSLDGARRWDTAYQLLLTWAQAFEASGQARPASQAQEEGNADRILRTGLDDTSTTEPDD